MRHAILLALLCAMPVFAEANVPGAVIDHVPAATGRYIGSPSLAILPDGTYVATHDEFGPKSGQRTGADTRVFRSENRGKTWKKIADITPAFWSNLFVHRGALYLLGTTFEYGALVIRRSDDGGHTWTTPDVPDRGLLGAGEYHTAPMPMLEHAGRLWRAVEFAPGPAPWGVRFQAAVMSAPVDADLLRAASWTYTNPLQRDATWLNGTFRAWLEGNAVLTPRGEIVDMLRVDYRPGPELAAMIHISADGKTARFDPARDFVPFPGGAKKFSIRYDTRSKRYWSLSNPALPRHEGIDAARARNVLALVSSPDLRTWTQHKILVEHPDVAMHGYQYPDWHFDGRDIVAVVRTAHDDDAGGAHNNHDANYLTFHRIKNFRKAK